MSESVLSVTAVGPLVSFQDGGRHGFMRYGVPASGPMDRLSHAAANAALGNPLNATCMEVSLGGVALKCLSGSITIAIAGGGFRVSHRGHELGSWSVLTLKAGDDLAIHPGFWGSWCYIAFAGLPDVPHWLGSTATHTLSGLGGGLLARGQKVHFRQAQVLAEETRGIACPVSARPRHVLRVTLGPQDRHFASETVSAFLAGPWRLSAASDRMGVRLQGPAVMPRSALDIPSEPITRGAVQVAGDGIPTILLADHQTTGGYPKIATVLDSDLDALAQLRPRAPIAFQLVKPRDAIQIGRRSQSRSYRYISAILNGLAASNDKPIEWES